MSGLIGVIIDGLLAQNHEARLFFVDDGLEQFGDGERLQLNIRLDQDCAISANGHGVAQRFLALQHASGDRNHFGGNTFFAQTNRLFNRDFAEWIHRHLDVGDVHTRVISLDAYFDVVVDNAFDRHQYLHTSLL